MSLLSLKLGELSLFFLLSHSFSMKLVFFFSLTKKPILPKIIKPMLYVIAYFTTWFADFKVTSLKTSSLLAVAVKNLNLSMVFRKGVFLLLALLFLSQGLWPGCSSSIFFPIFHFLPVHLNGCWCFSFFSFIYICLTIFNLVMIIWWYIFSNAANVMSISCYLPVVHNISITEYCTNSDHKP